MCAKSTLPPAASPLQHMRMPLAFSFANAATWMVALGTPLILLAGQLGASALQIGLLNSFVFLLLPVQVLATAGLSRFGFKRQMFIAWAARSVFLLIPLAIAFSAPENPQAWMVHALVLSVFLFCFFRCLGSCAYIPWIYQLIPDELRGRYFATDQLLTSLCGILTLLYCAFLFHYLPPYQAFMWQYLLAIIASVTAVGIISRIRGVPTPRIAGIREIVQSTPKMIVQAGGFRQYLRFKLTSALVVTSLPPFAAYYLKVEAGLSMERIIVYSMILLTGSIAGAWFLRGRLDGVGVKPVYQLSLLLQAMVFVFWVGYVAGLDGFAPLLPLAFFVFGIAMCLWNAAHLKYLPRVCPEGHHTLAISIHAALVGIVSGISPVLWGWFFRASGHEAGVDSMRFIVYLSVAAIVLGWQFSHVRQLRSLRREAPELEISGFIIRPLRFLSHLMHIPGNGDSPRKDK